MKINIKVILFTFVLLLASIASITKVNAATLVKENSDYFYERQDENGNHYSSWYWSLYTMDGEVTYCIEPGIPEGTTYPKTDYESTGLPNSIKERLLLIAYYGYTYPGHDTIKYRAATQGMIWETVIGNNATVIYTTKRYGEGTKLNISNERDEIEELIENHYVKPSFNGNSYTVQTGETITITDTNDVLENYKVSVVGANYSVNGNKLTITPTIDGEITVKLKKKMYYEDDYKIFTEDGKQNMLVAGSVDPVVSSFKIISYLGSVEISKKDSITEVAQGQATLEGAIYGIYKTDGIEVTRIITDENGYAKSDNVLSYGTYYLKEIKASNGYYLDTKEYEFDSKGKVEVHMDVTEDIVENKISILKQYDYVNGNSTFLNAEKNIKFDIYYPDGTLYKTVTTNSNGYAIFDLPFGVWTFHQVNTTQGYEKIKDFSITVDYDSNKEQYYNILNNKLSAYIQIVKKDAETGETITLPNTSFKILNVDTNKYMSQFVGGKTIDTFTTDENGISTTPLKVEAGNYKIVEIKSPKGYLINDTGVLFTIDENSNFEYTDYGSLITVEYENISIKGQIKIIKTGEVFNIVNNSIVYEHILLDGIEFKVYASENIYSSDGKTLYYKKDQLVDILITDENGIAISKELYLGKYYIKETSTKNGYVLLKDKFEIVLNEIDNKTSIVYETLEITNYLKKGKLEFTKLDYSESNALPNTTIEIYTENDELIFSGKTDKNGKVIIDKLPIGKYYIIETEAPDGYEINDEKVYFEIKENDEIVKAVMKDYQIVEVPNTDLHDYQDIIINGIIVIGLGIGLIIYGKKKK